MVLAKQTENILVQKNRILSVVGAKKWPLENFHSKNLIVHKDHYDQSSDAFKGRQDLCSIFVI